MRGEGTIIRKRERRNGTDQTPCPFTYRRLLLYDNLPPDPPQKDDERAHTVKVKLARPPLPPPSIHLLHTKHGLVRRILEPTRKNNLYTHTLA